eukprot:2531420-Rhodomonas_salina.2
MSSTNRAYAATRCPALTYMYRTDLAYAIRGMEIGYGAMESAGQSSREGEGERERERGGGAEERGCLLYTSDAADDM